MQRLFQILLIATTLGSCWLGMMIVHEFGHVLHAWLSGGTVAKVVLGPLVISRTDVDPNPHPLLTAWGGPIWGCLLPLFAWMTALLCRAGWTYLLRFFAGFCLIANGCYLGVGVFDRVGDAGDLVRHGTPGWLLVLFGIVTIIPGFWLWHGLGPNFGLGAGNGKVSETAAVTVSVLFVLLILTETLIFS